MYIKKDQIGNFRNISEDGYWPSWKKGEEKRRIIAEFLKEKPDATITEIAQQCKISASQVRRHRANLVAAGLWKVCGIAIAMMTSFVAGAYYANPEVIDEWVECRVKSRVENLEEEFLLWKEEKFL